MKYDNYENEKKLSQEMNWLRTRKLWVLIINYMRDAKIKPTAFKETDLIKLSFDPDEEEQVQNEKMSPEEVEKMFPKTINIKK